MFQSSGAVDVDAVASKIKEKMDELTKLVSLQEFGPDGPPKDLTWREIEAIGHDTGQSIAQQIKAAIQGEHREHFQEPQPCPQCGQECRQSDSVARELETRDGPTNIVEPQFHCHACRRAFFPSANGTET